MNFLKLSLLALLSVSPAIGALAHFGGSDSDPVVVSNVDFSRYVGKWLEIGHYPTPFQTDCVRSEAQYAALPGGKISVRNTCHRESGGPRSIEGTAAAPDRSVPAKLKVDFGRGSPGDYWIIELDKNYQWAVVSGPAKKSLFILARKAPMAQPLLQSILARLEDKGFDTTQIIFDRY